MLSVAHSKQQEVTNDNIKTTRNYDYNLLPSPIPFYIHLNYLVLGLKGSLPSAQWLLQPSILLEPKDINRKRYTDSKQQQPAKLVKQAGYLPNTLTVNSSHKPR
jgi:hypothetical protein